MLFKTYLKQKQQRTVPSIKPFSLAECCSLEPVYHQHDRLPLAQPRQQDHLYGGNTVKRLPKISLLLKNYQIRVLRVYKKQTNKIIIIIIATPEKFHFLSKKTKLYLFSEDILLYSSFEICYFFQTQPEYEKYPIKLTFHSWLV